ncbi:Protein TORNADO 1 [Zea mays]|uniref:Protein TORNADO 1 n=1 Tax=Zea mays TaxID=4577 RepID=A0A1D6L4R0_MAIZE|nr:Protein TORNADO 1 [Zea mays]ONM09361.1 Protein TORNADO 1 [Zea mays]
MSDRIIMITSPSKRDDARDIGDIDLQSYMDLENIAFYQVPANLESALSMESERSLGIHVCMDNSGVNFLHRFLRHLVEYKENYMNLRNILFHGIEWQVQGLQLLCSLLGPGSSVKQVEFKKNVFSTKPGHAFVPLSEMLHQNNTIKAVVFSECRIGSTGATLLASALANNRSVEDFQIWEDSIGSKGAEELSKMIEVNFMLKKLIILDNSSITVAPLISAVLARNRRVEVHIWGHGCGTKGGTNSCKIVEFLPETGSMKIYSSISSTGLQRVACALPWNTTVTTLDMSSVPLKSKWTKELRGVLERNRSLKTVKLSKCSLGDKAVVYIAAGLFKNSYLENLTLDGNRFGGVGVEHLLCPLSTFSPLQRQANTTLKVLSFGGERANISKFGVPAILQMLETNQSLIQLAICNDASLKPNDVVKIFTSLERNATLRSLSLRGCKGVEGEAILQTIMSTLEVNPWIEEIDLHGTPLHVAGKTDQIYEKLCQNESLVLPNDFLDLPLSAPTCCRVFLCGQESAEIYPTVFAVDARSLVSEPGNPDTLLLVPSILEESKEGAQQWHLAMPECRYVGRCLKCTDIHMFLTGDFFPRLQVRLQNKIMCMGQQQGALYILEKNLIYTVVNSIHVRVVLGSTLESSVDVLACSSKSVTDMVRIFHKLIIPTILNLSSSLMFEESIIRPDCVKYLIPHRFLQTQQLPLKRMKQILLSLPAESMYDYEHTWSAIESNKRIILQSGSDHARELLSDDDFHEVLHRRYYDLQHLATELAVNPDNQQQHEIIPETDVVDPSILGIAKGVEMVLQRLKRVEQGIRDLKEEIASLRYYEYHLLTELHRKMDYMMNYNTQLEERKVPQMFYLVSLDNRSKQLVTRILPGMRSLRVHMLCEFRREMHVVEDQLGCDLIQVDNQTVKSLLPYMSKFMKLLTFALKIGAHFIVGMGEMIPDLSREVVRLLDSSALYGTTASAMSVGALGAAALYGKSRNGSTSDMGEDMTAARQWLVDFLKGQGVLTGMDIAQRFGLWRVRYRDDGHIAWICRKHIAAREEEIFELPL